MAKKKLTNLEILENYLNNVEGATGKKIFEDLGILEYRKPLQILKNEKGVNIKSKWVTVRNRRGKKVRCKYYWIPKPDRPELPPGEQFQMFEDDI